ncbi:TetR/AcrR family transcriptional regulator [Nocardia jejuensis]|uniref:TetR/AcrR family transcriptional regulator n=1 Tax=Nocardia jejuensis TaxID=328049 RepID=UPI0008375C01|nr:TetR/AcrR family transcriptional regulator [Nocardia jejuensis]
MASEQSEPQGGRWGEHNLERRRAIMEALIALIDESEPGTDVPLQSIAERAGIRRSVIYRHFTDRKDLDAKTREFAVESNVDRLMPTLDMSDSLYDTVFRIIDPYVALVADRPRLHEWVEQGPGSQDPAGRAVVVGTKSAIAERISALFSMSMALLGIEEPGVEIAAYSVVSMVDGAVTHWVRSDPREMAAADVSRLLTDSVCFMVDGHARTHGITIDPHLPLHDLLAQTTADL